MLTQMKIFKHKYIFLFACCVLALFAELFFSSVGLKSRTPLILIFSFIFLLLLYFYLSEKTEFGEKEIVLFIFAIGFVLRLAYIHETDYFIRQHDVGGEQGHLDYMIHLYKGYGLPQNCEWQYYQPPVWHSLCALWLRIQSIFRIPMEIALENLQLISLFCSSAIMLLSHKLFKMFNLKGVALYIPCFIIACHPTFIILSGSINNDVLSLTLALFSVILALKWYKNPKFSTMILLAFSLGIAMGVKLSAGLISVGIAMLFVVKFFGGKNKKRLFFQFASFGAVCVPTALWWPIRNSIKFNLPLTYVPSLDDWFKPNLHPQNVQFRGVFNRIFDFSSLFENGVYPARIINGMEYAYYEYNIPLGALKSSVFGEYYIGKGSGMEFFSVILFYSAAILAIISLIYGFCHTFKAIKNKKEVFKNIFPFVVSFVCLGSYFKFCFDYPHFCTMDFRYIAICLVIGSLYIGLLVKNSLSRSTTFSKITYYGIILSTVLMCVSSGVLYLTIA